MLRSIAGAVVGEVIGRKRGNGLLGAGLGIVATRLASRSIPGAVLVGGALLAKTLYDKRKTGTITQNKRKRLSARPSEPGM